MYIQFTSYVQVGGGGIKEGQSSLFTFDRGSIYYYVNFNNFEILNLIKTFRYIRYLLEPKSPQSLKLTPHPANGTMELNIHCLYLLEWTIKILQKVALENAPNYQNYICH